MPRDWEGTFPWRGSERGLGFRFSFILHVFLGRGPEPKLLDPINPNNDLKK